MSPQVNNAGNGEPKAYTGLVGTHHRPSDDLSLFGKWPIPFSSMGVDNLTMWFLAFLTPANAMLSVELGHLADVFDHAGQAQNVSQLAREWSKRIYNAIWNTTVSYSPNLTHH